MKILLNFLFAAILISSAYSVNASLSPNVENMNASFELEVDAPASTLLFTGGKKRGEVTEVDLGLQISGNQNGTMYISYDANLNEFSVGASVDFTVTEERDETTGYFIATEVEHSGQ